MSDDNFESIYQEKVNELNKVIEMQNQHIHELKKEIEWFRQLAMNLSRRSDC